MITNMDFIVPHYEVGLEVQQMPRGGHALLDNSATCSIAAEHNSIEKVLKKLFLCTVTLRSYN